MSHLKEINPLLEQYSVPIDTRVSTLQGFEFEGNHEEAYHNI